MVPQRANWFITILDRSFPDKGISRMKKTLATVIKTYHPIFFTKEGRCYVCLYQNRSTFWTLGESLCVSKSVYMVRWCGLRKPHSFNQVARSMNGVHQFKGQGSFSQIHKLARSGSTFSIYHSTTIWVVEPGPPLCTRLALCQFRRARFGPFSKKLWFLIFLNYNSL